MRRSAHRLGVPRPRLLLVVCVPLRTPVSRHSHTTHARIDRRRARVGQRESARSRSSDSQTSDKENTSKKKPPRDELAHLQQHLQPQRASPWPQQQQLHQQQLHLQQQQQRLPPHDIPHRRLLRSCGGRRIACDRSRISVARADGLSLLLTVVTGANDSVAVIAAVGKSWRHR